jgi:hypothetical protein
MKRFGFALAALGVICVVAALSGYAQEDVQYAADTGFYEKLRPPVYFPHEEHNERAEIWDCALCHHYYDADGVKVEGETTEDMECSECHLPADGDPIPLATKYHLRCKGCHTQAKEGPVMCSECHRNR